MQRPVFSNTKFMDYAIGHMNDDHREDMVAMAKVYLKLGWAQDAEMLSYDAHGLRLKISDSQNRSEKHELNFPQALEREQDIRAVLVQMVKAAKAKL